MNFRRFPEKFFWGASTSSHQIEGDNKLNDWWEWEQSGGTEPSGKACDHYNRFREDISLAKELCHNSHRFGLEWSRLEKEDGKWDRSEWAHYKAVIDELAANRIIPLITLNHFALPLWFKNKGGWLNDRSPEYFARFCVKAIEELGRYCDHWITINEPNILAILSYHYGIWTPCKKDFNEAMIVLKNMLKGHVLAYQKMKERANRRPDILTPKIGIAKAVTAFHPCSRISFLDRIATFNRSQFHNHSFINSAIKGKVLLPTLPKEKLPIKKAMDFIGLNYYFRQFIHHEKPFSKNIFGEVCDLKHHPKAGKTTDMGWEIYPRGIYEVIKNMSRYKLPIIIAENGLATKDDMVRQQYIKTHLEYVLKAINEGAGVVGYLHWSLMDNFEWAEGYSKRFGLIEVNFKTQKRKIRDSGRYYASIITSGKIQKIKKK